MASPSGHEITTSASPPPWFDGDGADEGSAGSETRRVVGWFVVTLAILCTVAVFVYQSTTALIAVGRWVEHTHEVLGVLQTIEGGVRHAESAGRGYVLAGWPEALEAHESAVAQLPRDFDRLRRLTADNASEQPRLRRLETAMNARLGSIAEVVATYRRDGLESARDAIRADPNRRSIAEMRAALFEIETEERRLLQERRRAADSASGSMMALGAEALALYLGGLAYGFVLINREWSRRRRAERILQQTNAKLGASLHDTRELAGHVSLGATLGDYLHACRTPEEAYAIALKTVPLLLPGVSGAVGITSRSRTLVETALTWGDEGPFGGVFHPDECWGLRRGRPHVVGGGCDPVCDHLSGEPSGSFCLPMAVHGETLGVLSLATDRPGGLTDREQQAARSVAEQLSLALANLRLREALRDQSIRDPLTGLYNRRYLEEALGREICRAKRQGQPVSVVMADVDHFKRFNDSHGHEAGDAVLSEVGKLLVRQIRGEDVACRFGGEEFCLILPGADLESARRRADQIRAEVGRLNVRHGPRSLGTITMSAGVSSYPALSEGHLIAAADAALYRAKRAGRDRVEAADEQTPNPSPEVDPESNVTPDSADDFHASPGTNEAFAPILGAP